MQKAWTKQTGFTIVELLIVIVVIGILAAITIVAYNGVQGRARFATAQSDLRSINQAILMYYADNGKYPSPTSSCTNGWCGWDQATGENFIPGLSPKYIQTIPQMPTVNANDDTYLYKSVDGATYQLMRYKSSGGGLPSVELNSNLSASPTFTTTGWGYKSSNLGNWG